MISYASLLIVECNDAGILLINVLYIDKHVTIHDDNVSSSVVIDG
jgi:hypothetical protein